MTVALYAPAPQGGAAVSLSASPSSVLTVPATITVPEGELEATGSVTAGTSPQLTEVTVTASYGNEVEAGLSVLPPKVVSLTLNPSTVEGGQDVTAEVTLGAPAAAGTAVLLSSDNSRARPPESVAIAEGETTGEAVIETRVVPDTRTATIEAALPPTSAFASLTIEPLSLMRS